MGVIDLYFVDKEVTVSLSMKSRQLHTLYFSSSQSIAIKHTTVLLTQVAPEAMDGYL
jgi:hypothetical protein